MDKYKIVGKLRQLFFGSMAVVMSAGGVVATNMANAFAADHWITMSGWPLENCSMMIRNHMYLKM